MGRGRESTPHAVVVIQRHADSKWHVVSDLGVGNESISIDPDAEYEVGARTTVWLCAAGQESPATVTHALDGETERRVIELDLDPRHLLAGLAAATAASQCWLAPDDDGARVEYCEGTMAGMLPDHLADAIRAEGWEVVGNVWVVASAAVHRVGAGEDE